MGKFIIVFGQPKFKAFESAGFVNLGKEKVEVIVFETNALQKAIKVLDINIASLQLMDAKGELGRTHDLENHIKKMEFMRKGISRHPQVLDDDNVAKKVAKLLSLKVPPALYYL